MNKKFLRKTSNWVISIIILVLLAVIGCGIWFLVSRTPAKPPVEFLTARERGAEISQKIAELSSATAEKIAEINSLDLSNDYDKALSLSEDAQTKNREVRNQAVKLGNEVQKMAEFLDKVPSSKSQELAMKAITTEMSLLTNLMQYSSILDQFLGNLNLAFATSKSEYRQAAANNLSDLNLKTNTINNLNRQFSDQMREFDESFSR
ncbi:MAG: hypothetical protein Q8N22_02325 [bacterium]|nr:hypothetical protein [bacterium]